MLFEAAFAAMVMEEHASIMSGFQRAPVLMMRKEFGGDGAEATPGPIPNPEVKLRSGDDRRSSDR